MRERHHYTRLLVRARGCQRSANERAIQTTLLTALSEKGILSIDPPIRFSLILGFARATIRSTLSNHLMDLKEREAFKEQLRVMAAGRGDGIDLDSVDRWVIEDLRDAVAFFHQVSTLTPENSILYFEGCGIIPEVADFYARHRAPNAVPVVRDTIFPIPETFHVSVTTPLLEGMIALLKQHPSQACFDHVKAYRAERLLFAFHDAFDGSSLLVSDLVPEENVRAFASALGRDCRREQNVNKRDPEQLRRFLWALENPHKLRMNWPWWKKALLFWKK